MTEFVTVPLASLKKGHDATIIPPPLLLSSEPTPEAPIPVLKLKPPLSTLDAAPVDNTIDPFIPITSIEI